ncbi:hypothetical protein GLOTRDRAFT_112364 [Gloeophyllum trabeum ATCC 11539]|uniref:Uncharacterized protein n=1 Tax=Gloeophyllum trabeum (strain ATCC 11539 / FP-39264 / Madison 617) TaxID=670483 RepID=S7PXA2_GLOTA|nr:uncharacterized protein GLOTRDRAFT_112364 [Gloeophyllum trabeum ATCC 11539]EPQ51977.1 hypothetical protein GLOTRDRAFT_112364 [Gloeophyllum trabeum ATCC 11539]
MSTRKTRRFTPEHEAIIDRMFKWDVAYKLHPFYHAKYRTTNAVSKAAHAKALELLKVTEPYKIWATPQANPDCVIGPEYFDVADHAASKPPAEVRDPVERWLIVIVLDMAIQCYEHLSLRPRWEHLTTEAQNRARAYVKAQDMFDTTRFFERSVSPGPSDPEQLARSVGPHLFLCRIQLKDGSTSDVLDHLASSVGRSRYVLRPVGSETTIEMEESELEDRFEAVLSEI